MGSPAKRRPKNQTELSTYAAPSNLKMTIYKASECQKSIQLRRQRLLKKLYGGCIARLISAFCCLKRKMKCLKGKNKLLLWLTSAPDADHVELKSYCPSTKTRLFRDYSWKCPGKLTPARKEQGRLTIPGKQCGAFFQDRDKK